MSHIAPARPTESIKSMLLSPGVVPQDGWLNKITKLMYPDGEGLTASPGSEKKGWFASVTDFLSSLDVPTTPLQVQTPSSKERAAGMRSKATREILAKATAVQEREQQLMESFAMLNEERRRVQAVQADAKRAVAEKDAEYSKKLAEKEAEIKDLLEKLTEKDSLLTFLREKQDYAESSRKKKMALMSKTHAEQMAQMRRSCEEARIERNVMEKQRDRARCDIKSLEAMLEIESKQNETHKNMLSALTSKVVTMKQRRKQRRKRTRMASSESLPAMSAPSSTDTSLNSSLNTSHGEGAAEGQHSPLKKHRIAGGMEMQTVE